MQACIFFDIINFPQQINVFAFFMLKVDSKPWRCTSYLTISGRQKHKYGNSVDRTVRKATYS